MTSKTLQLLLLTAVLTTANLLRAQVNNYIFTSTNGVYTEITGGTVHGTGSNDDVSFLAVPIGFGFTYNGKVYTTVSINNNGFIAMGNTIPNPSDDSCIVHGGTNNLIAGLSDDLRGSTLTGTVGELRSQLTGTAPNRVFTVQWKNYISVSSLDNFNFQIKLYETTNSIEVVYGVMTTCCTSFKVQVGLRGSSNQDYLVRSVTPPAETWATSAAGTSNEATCEFSYTIYPPAGLTYKWALPALDMGVSELTDPIGCFGAGQTINVRVTNLGTQDINFTTNAARLDLGITGPNPKNYTSNLAGILTAGASRIITLSTDYDMSQSGVYSFNPKIVLTGDQFTGNDSLPVDKTVVFITPAAIPLTVDFNGYDGENLTSFFPEWSEASGLVPTGQISDWEVNTTFQQSAYPTQGETARMAFFGSNSRHAWLIGPKIAPTMYTWIEFKAALTTYAGVVRDTMGSDDKVQLMVSADCGATWAPVKTFDMNSYLGPNFGLQKVDLTGYAGQEIKLAFFATEDSIADGIFFDFLLDDIIIKEIFPIDVGASAVIDPMSQSCTSTSHDLSIVVTNYGTADAANVPVNVEITGPGTVMLSTVLPLIKAGDRDTVVFPTGFKPLTEGPYTITAYTSLATDPKIINDSVTVSRTFLDSPAPLVKDTTLCTPGPVTITADGQGIRWYDSATGGNMLGSGNTFTAPLVTTSTTYYAESNMPYNTTVTRGSFAGTRQAAGNMFDIKAKNTFTINSFDLHLNTTNAETIEIYYKSGTYKGSENNPADWTLLGTASVTGNGLGNPTPVNIGGLTVQKGQTVGLYITSTIDSVLRYEFMPDSDLVFTDQNIQFTFGVAILYPFRDRVIPRMWDGTIHYTSACVSDRVPATVNINSISGSMSGNQTICSGKDANLQVNFTGSPPWDFGYNNGVNNDTIRGVTSNPYIFPVKPAANTTYSLNYVYGPGCPGTYSGSAQVNVDAPPVISVMPSVASICAGSAIALTASGAADYVWGPSATLNTNIGPVVNATPDVTTTYKIIGSSLQGCVDSVEKIVTVIPTPSSSFTVTSPVCANTAARIEYTGTSMGIPNWTFSGGTFISGGGFGPFLMSWSEPGNKAITLSVTENGCSSTITGHVIVVNPAPEMPLVTTSGPPSICEGQSITLTADATDAVEWNDPVATQGNTLIVSTTGIYVAEATNTFGCSSTSAPVDIKVNPLPEKPVISVTPGTPLCEGEKVLLKSSYATGNTWSEGSTTETITITSGGNYTVTETDINGCTAISDPVTVTYLAKPALPVIIENGAVLSCSETGSAYQWIGSGGAIPGATGQSFEPSVPDYYRVIVYSAEGCSSDTSAAHAFGNVSISHTGHQQLSIYPNPNNGSFIIDLSEISGNSYIEVTDLSGKQVYNQALPRGRHALQLNLARGTYLLKVMSVSMVRNIPVVVQ